MPTALIPLLTAHPSAGQGSPCHHPPPKGPSDESLDPPSRSGVEKNDQFETTRDSGSSTNLQHAGVTLLPGRFTTEAITWEYRSD